MAEKEEDKPDEKDELPEADGAATDDGDEGEDGATSRPKKSKKLLILILIPLVLIVGASVALYLMGSFDTLLGGAEDAADAEVAADTAAPKEASLVFYDLPQILVNINTRSKHSTFLKVSIALELSSAEDRAKITELEPRIVDNFQVYLRELRLDELQGSAGMYRLKEELMARVNRAISPAKVNDVLFKEMLVQ